MKRETKTNMFNGQGEIHFIHLLEEEQMNGMLRVYAQVTLPPHSSIGFHTHHGDGESYYILSGEGLYHDDHQQYKVHAGDHTFAKDGTGHLLENIGSEPLVMMALIIYTEKK